MQNGKIKNLHWYFKAGVASFFCKGLESEYFRFRRPYGLSCNAEALSVFQ